MHKKILIIEDDPVILSNIFILLSENGYTALRAEDGSEGIKIAREELPDLVICDIMMPGLNGYEVFEEFLNDCKLKYVPFIFLTAKAEKLDIRKGMEMGADDYIVKPYNAHHLLQAIKTRLSRIEEFRNSREIFDKNDSEGRYNINDKIFLKVNGKPHFIKINHIVSIKSERQYTLIKYLNGKVFIMRKSVASWEKLLPKENFIRIHRSTIINFDMIERTETTSNSGLKIYLKNQDMPYIASKRYSSKLKKNLT